LPKTIHLPDELERYVQSEVRSRRFASTGEVITEALRVLRQTKQQAQSKSKALTPEELNRQLLEAGLISQIAPQLDPATYQEFSPIVVQGEPLSETIIRERR